MQGKWWLKPVLIGVLNLAVVLPVITLLVGWTVPVIAVVIGGFVLGCWWVYEQRPNH